MSAPAPLQPTMAPESFEPTVAPDAFQPTEATEALQPVLAPAASSFMPPPADISPEAAFDLISAANLQPADEPAPTLFPDEPAPALLPDELAAAPLPEDEFDLDLDSDSPVDLGLGEELDQELDLELEQELEEGEDVDLEEEEEIPQQEVCWLTVYVVLCYADKDWPVLREERLSALSALVSLQTIFEEIVMESYEDNMKGLNIYYLHDLNML